MAKDKEQFFSNSDQQDARFPHEYGSDLHWLWGWGDRLEAFIEDDNPPNGYSWMIFRPCSPARDAMLRFSVAYSHVIKQVDDFLVFTEKRFTQFEQDASDDNIENLAVAMFDLRERIRIAVEVIAEHEAEPEILDKLNGEGKKRVTTKPKRRGRKRDPKITRRNRKSVELRNAGVSVDDITDRFPGVSAENVRTIVYNANKERDS